MSAKPRATLGDSLADLRLMAFYCAYDTLYREVHSPTLRFGLSLVYSVQPIRDYPLVRAWFRWTGGARVGSRSFSSLIESAEAPPTKLKPIIEAYKRGMSTKHVFDADSAQDDIPSSE